MNQIHVAPTRHVVGTVQVTSASAERAGAVPTVTRTWTTVRTTPAKTAPNVSTCSATTHACARGASSDVTAS